MEFAKFETFRQVGEFAPNFTNRGTSIHHDSIPPMRFYVHKSCKSLREDFEGTYPIPREKGLVKLDLSRTIAEMSGKPLEEIYYMIAAGWDDNGVKMADVIIYSDINGWPGNPSVDAFSVREGVYVPENKQIACGDFLMVLGEEERYRRTTENLREYMENPPKIEGLVSV